jgi:hypothetical protein
MRRQLGAWPLCGLLTIATYNTWALWSPMNGHQQIFNGYLSELSASDQPNNLFFRAGDLTTAVIVGALGVKAFRVWPRLNPQRPRWWTLAATALILFGTATFLDAFLSMDCSPTLSARCAVLEKTGRLSAAHYAHTFTSVGAQVGIVASMVATYIAMRRAQGTALASRVQPRSRWQPLLLAGCIAEVVALVVMMAMLIAGVPGIGYPQAVMVAVSTLWFAAVGLALRQREAVPSRTRPEKESMNVG